MALTPVRSLISIGISAIRLFCFYRVSWTRSHHPQPLLQRLNCLASTGILFGAIFPMMLSPTAAAHGSSPRGLSIIHKKISNTGSWNVSRKPSPFHFYLSNSPKPGNFRLVVLTSSSLSQLHTRQNFEFFSRTTSRLSFVSCTPRGISK